MTHAQIELMEKLGMRGLLGPLKTKVLRAAGRLEVGARRVKKRVADTYNVATGKKGAYSASQLASIRRFGKKS